VRLEPPVVGHGLRLRPVEVEDARFILSLRLDPDLSRFIGETSPRLDDQRQWILDQQHKPDDFYCLIESMSGASLGTIGLYDISDCSAEWGRWLLKSGTPAAIGSAFLLYQFAFERLSLLRVSCKTAFANTQVVSFHDGCGLRRIRLEEGAVMIHGIAHDLVVHELDKNDWSRARTRLEALAKRAAHFLPS
jgi:RimJ/RimL family protein N-acetyltransferase